MPVKTFEELYCERTHCDASRFAPRVFRACLPWYVRPFAVLFGAFGRRLFRADRDLIAGAGEALTLARIENESREYLLNLARQPWWKKSVLRLSTERLKAIAIESGVGVDGVGSTAYRPGSATPPTTGARIAAD